MTKNVMITGAGRPYALGYNFVLRYLENGDNVMLTTEWQKLHLIWEQ